MSPRLFGTPIAVCILNRMSHGCKWRVGMATAGRIVGGLKHAQRGTGRHPPRRMSLRDLRLELFEMREQFLFVSPALQVEADHFVGP